MQGVEPAMLGAARSSVSKRPAEAARRSRDREVAPPRVPATPDRPAGPAETLPLRDLTDLLTRAWAVRLRALGVSTDFAPPVPAAEDPQELDALEAWTLREALLRHGLAGVAAEDAGDRLARAGRTPAGPLGERALAPLAREAAALVAAARRAADGGAKTLQRRTVRVALGHEEVAGEVGGCGGGFHLEVTASRIQPKRLASLWTRHVLLGAAGEALEGRLVGRSPQRNKPPEVVRLTPLPEAEARELLAEMLRWRERATREALPGDAGVAAAFFDRAGVFRPGREESALAVFHAAPFTGGRSTADDPSVRLAFGPADPVAIEDPGGGNLAAAMARALWSPLMAHLHAAAEEPS